MTAWTTAGTADCDVLIAGGGMVGASLAVALAGLPLRVALVEAIPAGSPGQPSFDARTTALSRSSQHILATSGSGLRSRATRGADPADPRLRARPARHHGDRRGRAGRRGLGYVLENRLLGAALWRASAAARISRVRVAGHG